MDYLPAILDIEYQVYEPARRTPPAEIRAAIEDAEGSLIVGEAPERRSGLAQLVGFAIGAPLEQCHGRRGPRRRSDARQAQHDVLGVDHGRADVPERRDRPPAQGARSSRDAAARKRPDGTPRYRYVTGRNRVGRTAQMTHLNRVFGAHVVSVLTGQYEDPEGQAIYYRIPLGALDARSGGQAGRPASPRGRPRRGRRGRATTSRSISRRGLTRPFATGAGDAREAEDRGLLYGPAVNKLTLMNYVTPATVRALEWIGALVPELPHLYLTSSRDEAFDKALRLIRVHAQEPRRSRSGSRVATTATPSASAARCRIPTSTQGGPGHFAWPRVPHPARRRHGGDDRGAARRGRRRRAAPTRCSASSTSSCRSAPAGCCRRTSSPALAALRAELELPLIAVETTTHTYRCGQRRVRVDRHRACRPTCSRGGAAARPATSTASARWFVGAPLTLVSTWDGDELSLVRQHHQLRAARHLDLAGGSRRARRRRSPSVGLGAGSAPTA